MLTTNLPNPVLCALFLLKSSNSFHNYCCRGGIIQFRRSSTLGVLFIYCKTNRRWESVSDKNWGIDV